MDDNAPAQDDIEIGDIPLMSETPDDAPSDQPSEPAQDKPDDGADTQDKPNADSDKSDDAKPTEATDQPKDGQDAQPTDDKTEAKRAWESRQARDRERQRNRQEVAEQIDREYEPKSEQALIDEGATPEDAKYEALRSEMQFERERGRVAELTASMRADAVEVQNDFPMFNPDSPEFDQEFANNVQQRYARDSQLNMSQDGSIIYSARVPLYQYYQEAANDYNRAYSRGKTLNQNDMQAMIARTENPGGSSSTRSPGNESLEDLAEKIGDQQLF